MKKLIIVGASGFGMETLWLAERCGRSVIGFLDDTPEKQNTQVLGAPVLGLISSWPSYPDCEFIVAIGSPRGRKSVVEKMQLLGNPSFTTLIDPNAIIGKEVNVESGSIICAGVICTVDIHIGRHVILNLNSTVGHESTLEDFCTIAPNVSVSGNVHLEALVEIGTGAKIKEKTRIERGSVLGMGSVLTKDVEAEKIVVGNPARVIKSIE